MGRGLQWLAVTCATALVLGDTDQPQAAPAPVPVPVPSSELLMQTETSLQVQGWATCDQALRSCAQHCPDQKNECLTAPCLKCNELLPGEKKGYHGEDRGGTGYTGSSPATKAKDPALDGAGNPDYDSDSRREEPGGWEDTAIADQAADPRFDGNAATPNDIVQYPEKFCWTPPTGCDHTSSPRRRKHSETPTPLLLDAAPYTGTPEGPIQPGVEAGPVEEAPSDPTVPGLILPVMDQQRTPTGSNTACSGAPLMQHMKFADCTAAHFACKEHCPGQTMECESCCLPCGNGGVNGSTQFCFKRPTLCHQQYLESGRTYYVDTNTSEKIGMLDVQAQGPDKLAYTTELPANVTTTQTVEETGEVVKTTTTTTTTVETIKLKEPEVAAERAAEAPPAAEESPAAEEPPKEPAVLIQKPELQEEEQARLLTGLAEIVERFKWKTQRDQEVLLPA